MKVNTKKAKAGDRVTIAPEAAAGYQVGTVFVKDEKGNVLDVVKNSDGTYSFEMPEGKVAVDVTFRTNLPFTDVPSNAYYADAVAWAVENGITTGMSATTFEPETACTRGQIVTFLYRNVK